jgi:prevent-host-death family protein
MQVTSVADLKRHLSAFLTMAEQGEQVEVRKRNVPVARLEGIPRKQKNRTKLGCGRGTGTIHGDLTETLLPQEGWDMLQKAGT